MADWASDAITGAGLILALLGAWTAVILHRSRPNLWATIALRRGIELMPCIDVIQGGRAPAITPICIRRSPRTALAGRCYKHNNACANSFSPPGAIFRSGLGYDQPCVTPPALIFPIRQLSQHFIALAHHV